jgi:hypothetical protein
MDTLKFILLCGSPLIFFTSLLLLCVFWKRELIRLAGLYSSLAGLNVIALILIFPWGDFDQTLIISAIMDFVFIIPIMYLFRKLYKMGTVVPWALLIFEIFRSARLILYSLDSRPKLTYFEAFLYYFYYFIPFAILLYCILTRNKSREMSQTIVQG